MNNDLSIYVHWPYCLSKCPYCDFNSHLSDAIDHNIWLTSYIRELEFFSSIISNKQIKSVFFGGGTPSLMKPSVIAGILQKIAGLAIINDHTEITLEANPTSFEIEKFKEFKLAGINRVSIGVQALNEKDLIALGRKHNTAQAKKAIEVASQLFPKSSFDLIYARSEQTLSDWQNELESAMELTSGHISLYQLTIEKGTPFYKLFHDGTLTLPDSDLAADMYEYTTSYLSSKGYNRYEISNYAMQGHESIHNLAYWHYKNYLGIGPGAHSRVHQNYLGEKSAPPPDRLNHKELPNTNIAQPITPRRFEEEIKEKTTANFDVPAGPSNIYRLSSSSEKSSSKDTLSVHSIMMWHKPEKWLKAVNDSGCGIQSFNKLTEQEITEELLMMGLRLKNGICSNNLFQLTGSNISDVIDKKTAELYINSGLLDWTSNNIRLTDKGLLLHSYLVPKLLA